ncbi:MAG: thioredoxin family protein [Candidatus Anstonellales archaeon]
MALFDENVREQVRAFLNSMESDVLVVFHNKSNECDFCPDIQELLKELNEINKKINFKVLDDSYELKPALEIRGKNKGKIVYYGIPSGYEFGPFLSALVNASTGNAKAIDDETKAKIKEIDKEVNIKIFVTPSCMYCPAIALASYAFSTINDNITTEIIEASEFPELSNKYKVNAVPKVIINDSEQFVGAVSPDVFVERIIKAIG